MSKSCLTTLSTLKIDWILPDLFFLSPPLWLGILNSLYWYCQTVGATCKNNSVCKKTCLIIPYCGQSKTTHITKRLHYCVRISFTPCCVFPASPTTVIWMATTDWHVNNLQEHTHTHSEYILGEVVGLKVSLWLFREAEAISIALLRLGMT